MPNVASIHPCGRGLVLLSKSLVRGACVGCCFARYLDNEDEFLSETCLKNSTFYGFNLPACVIVDASLIYIKLWHK